MSSSKQSSKLERDLAEARQSGTVAPAVDSKTGQMINPHNPEFLTKKPWYLSGDGNTSAAPTLEHQADQRLDKDKVELSLSEADRLLQQQRSKQRQRAAAGKFAKGQWVEALKRNKMPYRICKILKINKKGTEFDLQFEDGFIERNVKLNPRAPKPRVRMTKEGSRSQAVDAAAHGKETFDSKRDQYHGYDRDSHNAKLTAKFEKREAIRRKMRETKKESGDEAKAEKGNDQASDSDFDDSDVGSDDSDDEFVQRDEDAKVLTTRLARQGGVGGAQMKVTARNLRIREDTAKYLRNLDPNSAYYDPKSRSMRDNPNPEVPVEQSEFAGDNFARISGDAVQLADTQLFAWDASGKGVSEIHPQANPSQAEILKKQFKSKSANLKMEQTKAVLDKYGGQEYLDGNDGLAAAVAAESGDKKQPAVDRKLRFGVSTTKEEYGEDGRPANAPKLHQEAIPSKYEEDIFINGHTTVWGSYFHKGAFQWGYADDHSLMRNSYCTGKNGRIANDESNELRYGTGLAGSAALAQARNMLSKSGADKGRDKQGKTAAPLNRSKLYGEANQEAELDASKVNAALKRANEQEDTIVDDRKRKYHSMEAEVEISEEDMEAYRLRKEHRSDPMANLGSDELLDYKQ